MLYYHTSDVLKSTVFRVQLVIAIIINFGVNFGFEWATLNNYGASSTLEPMYFWKMNKVNTSIVADVLLTTFLVGFLSVTLATWGIKVCGLCFLGYVPSSCESSVFAQDEVRKKFNTHPIHKSVLERGIWWYYWPVRVQGVCKRGFAIGFYFDVLLGLPYLCLLAAVLGWDSTPIAGEAYCALKASYVAVCTIFIFPGMYFSAISSDKFESPEYSYLLQPVPVSASGIDADMSMQQGDGGDKQPLMDRV